MTTLITIIATLSTYLLITASASPSLLEWLTELLVLSHPPSSPAKYQNTRYQSTRYQGTKYQGTKYQGTKYQGTGYKGTKYQGTKYQGTRYKGTKYQGTKYEGIRYQGTKYQGGKCTCGIEGNRRIVGGTVVPRGKYPWIAVANTLTIPGLGGCSATLIASRWALTAAQCAGNPQKHFVSIVLGQYDIRNTSRDVFDVNRKIVKVERAIIHDVTQNIPYSNDLALLKLAEEVDLSVHTPVCLPAPGRDYTGHIGSTYGWGRTVHCNPMSVSPILQEASLQIVSDASCETASGIVKQFNYTTGKCLNKKENFAGKITEGMLCARATRRGTPCDDDNGGPLTVMEGGQHSLVGVVSWGAGCAVDNFYAVFVEVAKFRKWIDDNIAANGGAIYC